MLTVALVIAAAIFVFPGQVQLARSSGGWLLTWRPLWQVVFASPVQQAQPVVSERHPSESELRSGPAPASNGVLETV